MKFRCTYPGIEAQLYKGVKHMTDIEFSWHPISFRECLKWKRKMKRGSWAWAELNEKGWVVVQ